MRLGFIAWGTLPSKKIAKIFLFYTICTQNFTLILMVQLFSHVNASKNFYLTFKS